MRKFNLRAECADLNEMLISLPEEECFTQNGLPLADMFREPLMAKIIRAEIQESGILLTWEFVGDDLLQKGLQVLDFIKYHHCNDDIENLYKLFRLGLYYKKIKIGQPLDPKPFIGLSTYIVLDPDLFIKGSNDCVKSRFGENPNDLKGKRANHLRLTGVDILNPINDSN